jgi:hypothetical protein
MSLRHLNRRIDRCAEQMERQRLGALALMDRQHRDVRERARGIPIPVALGLAVVAGFVAERLVKSPKAAHALRLYSIWRMF